MRGGRLFTLALVAGIALTSERAAGAGRTRSTDVRFQLGPNGAVVVPVLIGGAGPFRFLLDTGASHTAMGERLAATLGAEAVATAPVATAAGVTTRIVVRLTAVAVGPVAVDSLLATTVPAEAFGRLGDDVSGVLGQDFLSHFNYTLDYRASRVIWNDEARSERGVRLPLEPSRGRFLVRLAQDGGCRCSVRFVPDSGADGVVLFTGTDADRLPIDRVAGPIGVRTLGGDGTARAVVVRELRVGQATLSNQPAASVSLPGGRAGEGDGLLPLHVFARVSFNHRDGYMIVEPR